jgi:hypothetical protein
VTIDDQLLAQLKQRAAETGQTVSRLVEDAIRESLLRQHESPTSRIKLRTWHGGGRLPGVDLYAHNVDEARHEEYSAWLSDALDGPEPFGISSVVLSGFVRIVTHPRIFVKPYSPTAAIEAASVMRSASAR